MSTSSDRPFLERRIRELQQRLTTHLDDLRDLETSRDLAQNPTQTRSYQHQIDQLENKITSVRTQLSSLDDELSALPSPLPTPTESPHIGFSISGIISILGERLYSSEYVFIRENLQNAVDAVRLRHHRSNLPIHSLPIQVTVSPDKFAIRDHGVGMSQADLLTYYWAIASTSKNTDEARSAKCVGEFGIGGFANFGLCERVELTTTTTSGVGDAIRSWVVKADLQRDDDHVHLSRAPDFLGPGTLIECYPSASFNEEEMLDYVREFAKYLPETVILNDHPVERVIVDEFPTSVEGTVLDLSFGRGRDRGTLSGRLVEYDGRVLFTAHNVQLADRNYPVSGQVEISREPLHIFKYQFPLCEAELRGRRLGGRLDLPFLLPTANRQGFEHASQRILRSIHDAIALCLVRWISQSADLISRYWSEGYRDIALEENSSNLLDHLRLTILDGEEVELAEIINEHPEIYLYRGGSKTWMAHAGNDVPIVDISTLDARIRDAVEQYLRHRITVRQRPDDTTQVEISLNDLRPDEQRAIGALNKWLEISGLDTVEIGLLQVDPRERFVARCAARRFEINVLSSGFRKLADDIAPARDERAVMLAGSFALDYGSNSLLRMRRKVFAEGGLGVKYIEKYLPENTARPRTALEEVETATDRATGVTVVSDGGGAPTWQGEGHNHVIISDKARGETRRLLRVPMELVSEWDLSNSFDVHVVAFTDQFYCILSRTDRLVCIRARSRDSSAFLGDLAISVQGRVRIDHGHGCPVRSDRAAWVIHQDGVFVEVPMDFAVPVAVKWAVAFDSSKGGNQERDPDSGLGLGTRAQ